VIADDQTNHERRFLSRAKIRAGNKAGSVCRAPLLDTLAANQERCVGMAANMIGMRKRIIIVNIGFMNLVMYNPVLLKKDTPYETFI